MLWMISALTGAIACLCFYSVFSFAAKLRLEKHLKGRIEGAKAIQLRGLTGNALFLAEKAGRIVASYDSPRVSRYAEKLKSAMTMLGGAYTAVTPHTFIGMQILCGIAAVIVFAIAFNTLNLPLMAAMGTGGFILPFALLQQKIKERHKAIFRQIPDVLDLLSLMIEAGLDFSTALQRVTEAENGPLIDELRAAQQEIRLGKSRADALNDMAEKSGFLPLKTMINTFTLAIKTGASIAPTLDSLSGQFRTERAQQAEKLAQEAPVKLLIPLVIFIFPTIFIILFGPILLSFLGN